jgi:putative membrane protein
MSDHERASREDASDAVPSPAISADERQREGHAKHHEEGFRHTRTSAAWVAISMGVLFGVALIDFIAQNTRDVRIEFFSTNGHIPIAVALLAAALAGAVVVLAIGVGRVAQLRLTMRRQRRGAITSDRGDANSSTSEGSS